MTRVVFRLVRRRNARGTGGRATSAAATGFDSGHERDNRAARRLRRRGYTVEAAAPFRIADVLAGTNVVLTTFEGTDPSGLEPVIVIVRTLDSVNATGAAQIGETAAIETARGAIMEVAGSVQVSQ